jgi:hypothetical protein
MRDLPDPAKKYYDAGNNKATQDSHIIGIFERTKKK